MPRDCGWVEILREDTRVVIARGRALLTELPGTGETPEWEGQLLPLRLADEVESLPVGICIMRFERNGEELRVQLEPQRVAAGTVLSADVRRVDGDMPSCLTDPLGGE